jgi:hypothetical protein
MKSERRSLPRSPQAFRRRSSAKGQRIPVESKCLACGQAAESALQTGGTVARKRPSNALNLQKLLHFSQQLYAHALTLQEVIRNEGEVAYEVLRPRYDQQAAQQFETFYRTFQRPSELRRRGA